MKAQVPAVTHAAMVNVAGRKARKVQRKLLDAEADLHAANGVLSGAVPAKDNAKVEAALEQNIAAEEKVHEASEELEIVKHLLDNVQGDPATVDDAPAPKRGSGEGLQSLVPHMTQRANAPR